ncbi:BrnA antitoxin family protein [Methylobacterium sp. J-077]|uniref:BrnA antitoxin family protein n=1 Tax=Methylobacterium sp. J-077 TaxID=2836656 RepID=UPI001FBB5289|nr:BrnA antitoxin family protein [Methylobacterium sp. J-077]MCJ2123928.1 BrnA antitoxin family protein [Methylobacterium sp. J-077]
MADDRNRRRFTDPRTAAEAAFKAATTAKPAAAPAPPSAPRPAAVPGAREMVTLRLDSAVLAHFQKDGPGWQDRVNEALKALVPAAHD